MNTATSVFSPITIEAPGTSPLFVEASAHPLLKAEVRETLERLLKLLDNEARAQSIPVSKSEVRGFTDPEDEADSLVVTQWVEAPVQTALTYWDRLGAAVEIWTNQLPKEDASLVAEQIAVEVRWEPDARPT